MVSSSLAVLEPSISPETSDSYSEVKVKSSPTLTLVGDEKPHIKAKKMSRVKKLQEIYSTYGANSNEFYIQVAPFLTYIMFKMTGGFDEVLLQECFTKVVDSLNYFDPQKSNIASFITVVTKNRLRNLFKKQQKLLSREVQDHEDVNNIGYTEYCCYVNPRYVEYEFQLSQFNHIYLGEKPLTLATLEALFIRNPKHILCKVLVWYSLNENSNEGNSIY